MNSINLMLPAKGKIILLNLHSQLSIIDRLNTNV